MSTIKRYDFDYIGDGEHAMLERPDGEYVTYTDHLAAVEAAVMAEREQRRPLNAAEVREFISPHFNSCRMAIPGTDNADKVWGGSTPDDNDVWEVTTHDLLSSFDALANWKRDDAIRARTTNQAKEAE